MFQDGFGARSIAIDQENGEAVDVLSFVPLLADVSDFAEAVSERAARLARVRHAMYARVRRIVRPSEHALLLLSDRIEGWRLANVLTIMERERIAFDVSAILVLLRQLIPAVSLFSRHQRDAAIGTIGPERLILTPQGRLVLTEYVLAPGLEQLQFSRERLWRGFRVAVPPNANPARIPPSADVVGIGIVALSLVIGRTLQEDEYLASLGDLVETATEVNGRTTRKLTPGFVTWLARMLQFDDHNALRTTHEAQIAFEEMLAKERSYVTTATELDGFLAKHSRLFDAGSLAFADPPPVQGARSATGAPAATGPVSATSAVDTPDSPTARSATDVSDSAIAVAIAAVAHVAEAPLPERPVAVSREAAAVPTAQDARLASNALDAPVARSAVTAPKATTAPTAPLVPEAALAPPSPLARLAPLAPARKRWDRAALVAVAVVAVLEAALIAWLMTRDGASLTDTGELVVQSRPVAARVAIDGEDRGITPFSTELSAGSHVLEVRVGKAEPRVIPLVIRSGMQSGIYVELQSVATVGGLEVRSAPATARVSVAGQYRGVTPLVLKDLPPGEIEVTLQSASRQVRQTVRIEPGITSQLVVPLDR